MDYIITTYPISYCRYLIEGVEDEGEAWEKFFDWCPDPFDEDYVGDNDGNGEIEIVTPELKRIYGLEE